mmetsp:Transcript_15455/g.27391  ORF Transcript_15455/g.27391 Transcript_15455/m.27391 type:complete len:375 (-) Transcript_15455:564-1688(-)
MSSLTRRLYWRLLHRAADFDRHPALKGVLKDLDAFEPLRDTLRLRSLYSPSQQQSFVQMARRAFHDAPKEGVNVELGFNVLRYLNEAHSKFFRSIYPSEQNEEGLQPKTMARVQHRNMLRRMLKGPRTWAMPVQVKPHESLSPLSTNAITPTTVPTAPMDIATSEMNPLTPGVILATHPLSEWPFSKCTMLVLKSDHKTVYGLILNYPRTYPVGHRNWVVPQQLRQQSCHIGGPLLSGEMPPVPNYHIIHHFPSIAGATVLLPDPERPVCISTGEGMAAIADYVSQGKASSEDFQIYVGSVAVRRFELEKQVQDGFWMPVLASANFVHQSSRLGPLFWDGLMESCGGEFADMPLITEMIERQPRETAVVDAPEI